MLNDKNSHPPDRDYPRVGVITRASAVLLLLVLTGCRGETHSSSAPTPTTDMLRRIIVGHYQAIEGNRLDEAMHHYHSRSPGLVQTRENIEFGLSQFLLKTTTTAFCYFGADQELAIARARHRHLVISGVKFAEHFADVEYQLRAEQGKWKIWAKQDVPAMNTEENCAANTNRSSTSATSFPADA